MKNKWKTIGILGGMGPEASQDIYLKIIQYVQKKYHPKTEADYPPIIIYSLPLNGLNDEGIEDGERIPTQLISGIHALEKAGADFIIIPCNTVHKFYDELVKSSKVPLINVLKVTLDCVAQKNFKKLGLISTQTTVEDKLYHKHCDKMGITLLTLSPYNQIKINSIIGNISRGIKNSNDQKILNSIISDLSDQGAEGVIFGCTEIGLIFSNQVRKTNIFDSSQVLAEYAVDMAFVE